MHFRPVAPLPCHARMTGTLRSHAPILCRRKLDRGRHLEGECLGGGEEARACTVALAPAIVVMMGTLHASASRRRSRPSATSTSFPVDVMNIMLMSLFFSRSEAFGRSYCLLWTTSSYTLLFCRCAAVPRVAMIPKPSSCNHKSITCQLTGLLTMLQMSSDECR